MKYHRWSFFSIYFKIYTFYSFFYITAKFLKILINSLPFQSLTMKYFLRIFAFKDTLNCLFIVGLVKTGYLYCDSGYVSSCINTLIFRNKIGKKILITIISFYGLLIYLSLASPHHWSELLRINLHWTPSLETGVRLSNRYRSCNIDILPTFTHFIGIIFYIIMLIQFQNIFYRHSLVHSGGHYWYIFSMI